MSQGKLFVISGASGVGKGTVLKRVMEKRDGVLFSVSATTRDPRDNEIDGVHYDFITKDAFEEMIRQDGFLEYSSHHDNYYGTPSGQVMDKLSRGHVLLDIDPVGAKQVLAKCPDATLIFIMPPSVEELRRRLEGRATDAPEVIQQRIDKAEYELSFAPKFDKVVINDDLDTAKAEALAIIKEFIEA
jgi:guanylate kinase